MFGDWLVSYYGERNQDDPHCCGWLFWNCTGFRFFMLPACFFVATPNQTPLLPGFIRPAWSQESAFRWFREKKHGNMVTWPCRHHLPSSSTYMIQNWCMAIIFQSNTLPLEAPHLAVAMEATLTGSHFQHPPGKNVRPQPGRGDPRKLQLEMIIQWQENCFQILFCWIHLWKN